MAQKGTPVTTATPQGARAHARAQADTVFETMATLPPSRTTDVPAGVDATQLTWAETVSAGGYTSVLLQTGDVLCLTDLRGDACAHLLLYNARQPVERLNVADTIKVQWQAYPAAGTVLLSDLGRALATVMADSSGHHDALCGTTTRQGNAAKYGDGSTHGPAPAGRELFVLAATKHGLGPRDVPPSLSLFQAVRAGASGALDFAGSAGPGGEVRLQAEMPLLALIANTAHPLDPRTKFTCTPLRVRAWRPGTRAVIERSPEMARALLNTAAYLTMSGFGS